MTVGNYIDHGNGNIIDMTQRFASFIDYFDTNGQILGSITRSDLIGKKFFFVSLYTGSQAFNYRANGVPVDFNSTTGVITWDYSKDVINGSVSQPYRFHRIYFGAM